MIGGWPVRLFTSLRPEVIAELGRRLGPFGPAHGPCFEPWTLSLSATREMLAEVEAPEMRFGPGGFRLRYTLYEAAGPLHPPGPIQARVRVRPGSRLSTADRVLGLLRVLATELLRPAGTLVFHGATLVLSRGFGVMVVATRGGGKTTFASGPWVRRRFSDDHALLRLGEGGGDPEIVGVPFTGRERLATEPGSSSLHAIVLPEPGPPATQPSARRVDRGRAAACLVRNLICLDDRRETFEGNLDGILRLLDRVPAVRLRYHRSQPSDRVQDAILAATEG